MMECLAVGDDCHGIALDEENNVCQIGMLNDTVTLAKGEGKQVYAEKGFIPPKGITKKPN